MTGEIHVDGQPKALALGETVGMMVRQTLLPLCRRVLGYSGNRAATPISTGSVAILALAYNLGVVGRTKVCQRSPNGQKRAAVYADDKYRKPLEPVRCKGDAYPFLLICCGCRLRMVYCHGDPHSAICWVGVLFCPDTENPATGENNKPSSGEPYE